MKKLYVLLILLLLCGCSNKVILNCNFVDSSSILGSKSIIDIITFKNNKIVSFERDINFSLHSDLNKDVKSIYKTVKLEAKSLKKYIGGKYRISKYSDSVKMSFNSKRIGNLIYIGIDGNYGYDDVLGVYSNLGFECK